MSDLGDQRVADLTQSQFASLLRSGLGILIGPFRAKLKILCPGIEEPLYLLYREYPLLADDNVFSFHVRLEERGKFLRRQRRKVRFSVDGRVPHEDMPSDQALAVLEWGINLVIAMRSNQFLMLHSAAVERDDKVTLLPAAPGSGKSTLCAAMSCSGWRLFSDEFGLVRPCDNLVTPAPRPIALKDGSIDVIKQFFPDTLIGPKIYNTRKGTVAHAQPPPSSVRKQAEPARAWRIVYPSWQRNTEFSLNEISPAESFMQLATNAFNYELLGEAGFETIRLLVEGSRSFTLRYSHLDDAIGALDTLETEEASHE